VIVAKAPVAGFAAVSLGLYHMAYGGFARSTGKDLPLFTDIPKELLLTAADSQPRDSAPRQVLSFGATLADWGGDVLSWVRMSKWADLGSSLIDKMPGQFAKYCPYNQQSVATPRACPPSRSSANTPAQRNLAPHRSLQDAQDCMPYLFLLDDDSGLAAAHDPNEKTALGGYGARNFVAIGSMLRYQIDFENLDTATAPAQIVTIRDPLPGDLDLATFEIAEIGFGEIIVPVGQGRRYFEAVIDYPYTDDDYDFLVEVHVEAWLENGVFHANLITLDPDTGLPPQDVGIGFLPPENETGRGQGYVAYTIRPKDSLSSGTTIRNIATIQFDFGLEIDTNQVDPLDPSKGTDPDKEALVTLDIVPPASRVEELPDESPPRFTVHWSGTDDASGVRAYDLYVSRDGADYEPWLLSTSATNAVFTGDSGITYRFYSVATDNAGNRESKTALAEAITTVSLPPQSPRIIAAGWDEDSFLVQVPTEPGRIYALEYADQLENPDWIHLELTPGDGTVQTLVDAGPPETTRFYRIRVE
jgi:hypothetical protein